MSQNFSRYPKNPSFVNAVTSDRSDAECLSVMTVSLAMNRRFVTGDSCRGELAHNGFVGSVAYSVHRCSNANSQNTRGRRERKNQSRGWGGGEMKAAESGGV